MTYSHCSFQKTIWLVLLALMPLRMVAQEDNPYNHRGVQYATQGTDFWVCFPRTNAAYSANYSELYVVCERDCDVTVSAPRLDWSQTYHIMHRRMCPPDTNYIIIPEQYCRFLDMTLLSPEHSMSQAPTPSPFSCQFGELVCMMQPISSLLICCAMNMFRRFIPKCVL